MSDELPRFRGFLPVPRTLFDPDHPLWGEPRPAGTKCLGGRTRFEAFLDLMFRAAFKDQSRPTRRSGLLEQKRGEVVASFRHLAVQWHWSVKRTRTFLETLTKMGMIEAQRETQDGIVYAIVGYGDSDSRGTQPGTDLGRKKGTARAQKGHTEGTQRAQEEECSKNAVRTPKSSRRNGGAPDGAAPAESAYLDAMSDLAAQSATRVPEWAIRVAGFFEEDIGPMDPKRVYRALGPAVEREGEAEVVAAARKYTISVIAGELGADTLAFANPENLAGTIVGWIRHAAYAGGDSWDAAVRKLEVEYGEEGRQTSEQKTPKRAGRHQQAPARNPGRGNGQPSKPEFRPLPEVSGL